MSAYLTNDKYYSKDTELLIRLSAITKGELLERRKDIRKSLVLAAIDHYKINDIFDSTEVDSQIEQLTKCKLISEDIISVLNELEYEGLIDHIGELHYKIKTKTNIPDIEHIIQPVWKEFQTFIKNRHSEYDQVVHINAKKIFESVLMKVLTRFSVSELLENQLDTIPIEDFKSVIDKELENIYFPDDFGKKYPNIIFEYLHSNSPLLLDFIFESYYGLINIDLVSREQELPQINFCEKINFLLLDTNFIIPLICDTDPKNPLSLALVKQCRKYNIPLYYSRTTIDEIWRSINSAQSEMKSLNSKKGSIVNNQIVAHYVNSRQIWSEFSVYLDSWENVIQKNWNIIPLPPDMSSNIDEDNYKQMKDILPLADKFRFDSRAERDVDYHFHLRNDNAYKHDAYCIGIVGYLKKNTFNGENSKPLGPWFLSYDNLVSFVNSTYIRKDDVFGYVIQPRALLNYFLAYSKIHFDVEDKETVAIALLRFTARSKNSSLSIEEYSRLVSVKVNFGEENSEIMKEIFLKSPLLEELERALRLDNGEEADSVAYNILSHPGIQDLIQEVTYSKKEKEISQQIIERLREALIRERKEREKETENMKNLQETIKSAKLTTSNSITNNIYGNSSKINFNSPDNSINDININSENVFEELKATIEKSITDANKRSELIDQIDKMKNTRNTSTFKESFKNFISMAADCVTLVTPFLPYLTSHL